MTKKEQILEFILNLPQGKTLITNEIKVSDNTTIENYHKTDKKEKIFNLINNLFDDDLKGTIGTNEVLIDSWIEVDYE